MSERWRDLITIEPGKRSGKPCIRGMRITVDDILSSLAAGMSEQQILDDFPYLTAEDIHACLAYAGKDDQTFLRLCEDYPEMHLERDAAGEIVMMAPAGAGSSGRNAKLVYQLENWVQSSGLGKSFESSAGFVLPNGARRSPDASWISTDRWNALSVEEQDGFPPLCPDFVVEIRSPSDRLPALRAKMDEYVTQGARLGWLIDPQRRVVEIYRPGREVEVVVDPVRVSGNDVLPGFVLDLRDILTS
jgi:Uma2 family endonuclease